MKKNLRSGESQILWTTCEAGSPLKRLLKRLKLSRAPLLVFSLILGGCATSREKVVALGGELKSESLQKEEAEQWEAALWFQRDLEEKYAFWPDEALELYLKEAAQPFLENLEIPIDRPFVFRVIRDPTVNAYALLTGHIYFHSGILARLRNEAELASVLAHEISHTYHRDVLYSAQNLQRKTVTFKVIDLLATAPAAFFGAEDLSTFTLNLIHGASVLGYGREAEAAADRFALQEMLRAGYDPKGALAVREIFAEEHKKYQKGMEIFFLSDHPSNRSRKRAAERWLKTHQKEVEAMPVRRKESERYLAKTYEIRRENARFNLDLDRYFHALDDIERILKENGSDPIAWYYRGEAYRRMPGNRKRIEDELSNEGWDKIDSVKKEKQDKLWRGRALRSYRKAIALDSSYPPPYKGLGILFFDQRDYEKAKGYFEKYLALAPEAKDRRSVLRYLSDIQELSAHTGRGTS